MGRSPIEIDGEFSVEINGRMWPLRICVTVSLQLQLQGNPLCYVQNQQLENIVVL